MSSCYQSVRITGMKEKSKVFSTEERAKFNRWVFNHVEFISTCGCLSHFKCRSLSNTTNEKTGMEIDVDHKYLEYDLAYQEEWAKDLWDKKEYETIIRFICHELTHIIINEVEAFLPPSKNIKDKVDLYLERSTEHTSRWLYRLYLRYMENWKIDMSSGQIGKTKRKTK
jgi:hypothetical protein